MLREGGMPGVEYLYVAAHNVVNAQHEGWTQLKDMPFFKVQGIAITLMGRGKPIPAARPGAVRCRFFVDDELLALTGQDPSESGLVESLKVSPDIQLVPKKPKATN